MQKLGERGVMEDPGINVRMATASDIGNLASLRGGGETLEQRMLGFLNGTYSPSYALESRVVWVAEVDGEFAGYTAGQATTRYGCDGELQWMNVEERFRGTGVADALIRKLISWFIAEQLTKVCVDVDPANTVARKFYARHGAVELNPHWMVWPDIRESLSA